MPKPGSKQPGGTRSLPAGPSGSSLCPDGIQLLPPAVCQPRPGRGRARGPPRRRPRPCGRRRRNRECPTRWLLGEEATRCLALLRPPPLRRAGRCPAAAPPVPGTYLEPPADCGAPRPEQEATGRAEAPGSRAVTGWRGETGVREEEKEGRRTARADSGSGSRRPGPARPGGHAWVQSSGPGGRCTRRRRTPPTPRSSSGVCPTTPPTPACASTSRCSATSRRRWSSPTGRRASPGDTALSPWPTEPLPNERVRTPTPSSMVGRPTSTWRTWVPSRGSCSQVLPLVFSSFIQLSYRGLLGSQLTMSIHRLLCSPEW